MIVFFLKKNSSFLRKILEMFSFHLSEEFEIRIINAVNFHRQCELPSLSVMNKLYLVLPNSIDL